jgi:hypothetical protein
MLANKVKWLVFQVSVLYSYNNVFYTLFGCENEDAEGVAKEVQSTYMYNSIGYDDNIFCACNLSLFSSRHITWCCEVYE